MLKYVRGSKHEDTNKDGQMYRVTVEVNGTEYTAEVLRHRHMTEWGLIKELEAIIASLVVENTIRSNLRELIERKAE